MNFIRLKELLEIDFIKENAGKKMLLPSFRRHIKMCMTHTEDLQKEYADFMKLPALFTQKNLFTFQAQGCYTNKRKIQFHMPLAKANALDVMQIWNEWLMEQEKEEFYIPKMVNKVINDGTATMRVLKTTSDWFGVTYKEDKPLLMAKLEELIERGLYPRNLW